MKKVTLFLITSFVLSFCTITGQTKNTKVLHATYSVESRLKSKYNIDKSDFRDFQFVYLMAAPKWVSKDFDLSQKAINKKYVEEHRYKLSPQDGIALVPYLIKKYMQTDVKFWFLFPERSSLK